MKRNRRTVPQICAACGNWIYTTSSAANRAAKIGSPTFCDRWCFGASRRRKADVTAEQLKAAKADYDREYREHNRERLRLEKAARYQLTRDPEKEKAYRQANMHRHVEYCRRPEYKEWKRDYDIRFRAQRDFGEFAEAALVLGDLRTEIDMRATREDIYRANGTLNKWQQRKRDLR